MPSRTTVIAGRCSTTYEGAGEATEHRGDLLVVHKPDDTVLVHDADGYQPVAWLTRAERVAIAEDGLTAWDGDAVLEVTVHERAGGGEFPTSPAGHPVGACPTCDEPLVRTTGGVRCLHCETRYGLPADATVLAEACPDCGLPRAEVVRGERFRVCIDADCESLDERVTEAFDREWDCPTCGEPLRVIRRGGLLLGCDAYPDCETSLSVPRGPVVEECACGLPVVETATGERCLDSDCDRAEVATP